MFKSAIVVTLSIGQGWAAAGWSIPSTVDEIDFKKVDAEFVLVVEKNAGSSGFTKTSSGRSRTAYW